MGYKCLLFFFSLLINISYKDALLIDVTPLTGLLNSKYDSRHHIFTFDILCKVNKNITHTMGKINIKIKVKKHPINNEDPIEANCNIIPVRVAQNSVSETYLKCSFNTNNLPFIKQDTILIYSDYIQQDSTTLSKVQFRFNNFGDISSLITVNIESLNNINNSPCVNDKYIFEMNTEDDFKDNSLLESTICIFQISGDEFHKSAKCVIPMETKKMKCYIDIKEKKYKKSDNIVIEEQNIVPCENGQAISLSMDSKKILSIEECGSKIFANNSNKFLFSLLFIFIFF
jgi:hypothetical protein